MKHIFILFLFLAPSLASPIEVYFVDQNDYTFDASEQTVTISRPDMGLVIRITNITDQVLIYNPIDPDCGGSQTNGVVTLNYDTGQMSDSDKLLVIYQSTKTGDLFSDISEGKDEDRFYMDKFGRTTNADLGIATDIHDGADSGNIIWDAPTAARVHQVASTSANDDGDPAGTGLQTVTLFGLTSWTTAEISEVVTLNGLTNVPTANSYVIIHRMRATAYGTAGPNVGIVTATADVDGTVTATMLAGNGSTQMAIYGVPSIQTLYMTDMFCSLLRAGGAGLSADVKLLFNTEADDFVSGYVTIHVNSIIKDGLSGTIKPFLPYKAIPGPVIVKLQVIASANDSDIFGGFNGYLVNN